MNKNPILPNWKHPRREPFSARRGILLLRAWREQMNKKQHELFVQTQFAFDPSHHIPVGSD